VLLTLLRAAPSSPETREEEDETVGWTSPLALAFLFLFFFPTEELLLLLDEEDDDDDEEVDEDENL